MNVDLNRELERWLADGLVSGDQAETIRARYRDTAASERRARVVKALALVGAVVVGVGVILFFAANWDGIPRGARLALLVVALVASYGGGFFLREVREIHRGIGHALLLLGSILFGAGLFLVGQMYHVQAHDPLAFLAWAVAAAAAAVVARSAPIGTLAILTFGAWIVHELYLADRGSFTTAVYIPPVLALYGAALYGVGTWGRDRLADLEVAGPMRGLGYTICLLGSFVFTFRDAVGALGEPGEPERRGVAIVLLVSFALAAAVAGALLTLRRERPTRLWEGVALVAVAALAVLVVFVPESRTDAIDGAPIFYPVAFNLLVAVLALGAIVVGYQNDEVWLVNAGILVVAIDVIARYFDFFWEMLPRSFVFIGVGALILTLAYVLERQRSRLIERMER